MSRITYGILALSALLSLVMALPAKAADVDVVVKPKAEIVVPGVKHGRLATVVPPGQAYGCKRLWRCDAQICEWRRGCWGIYGYVEGPYYSVALARRQWARDGLPGR